ncbi:unnamed protein product, partial [Effrenium voratum]
GVMEKSKEPPTKPVWRRLRVPKMQHQLKSSLPRVLSRYARSDNARRRAVKGEIQAFGIMPARSEPNEEEEEEEPGALGQLRHLFDFPDRRRPAVGSPKAEAKPTFAQLRKKHGRLRFPRLAEKAGYDEELNRRNAALAAGRRRESTPNESDEEDELEERSLDTRSFWTMGSTTGSTFYSSYSSQRALRHRRLGPSPRPAILRRQHPVPAVSVGTTSTFHVNPLDAQNDLMGLGLPSMGASTASLLSSNLASTQPAPSVSSWAPSVAASQGSVDRKWLARVAPISYLPSEAGTCAMRKDLLMEELQRLAGRKSMRMQRTVQALDSLTSAGSAGGYLSFENWGLTDDYLEALLEAHDGLGVREKKITDVPNGLVGVKHIHLGGNLLTERGLQVLVSVEGPADTLQTLNLTSNRLGLQGGSLCDSVASLYSLVELDLGSNQLGDAVTAELCRALAQGCPLLEGLGLARCRIGESWRAAAAGKALKELLAGISADFSAAAAEKGSARLLSNIFEDCKTLFHLDLSYNGFDTEEKCRDCAAMAVGLRSNHSLFGRPEAGMKICVRTLAGAESFLELPSALEILSFHRWAPTKGTATALDLKLAIQQALHLPRREQRLVVGPIPLHDGQRLADLAEEEAVLQVCLIRLEGARPGLLEGLASGMLALQDLGEELRGDKELVLAAVSANGWCLEFASPALRADKAVALAAVQSDAGALEFASESLRRDRDVVLSAARRNGWALAFAEFELRKDKEIVQAAVCSNPLSLQFASKELQNDTELVLSAVRRKGQALRFASEKLRTKTEVVLGAVSSDPSAIQLCASPGVVLQARFAQKPLVESPKPQALRVNAAVRRFLPSRLHLVGNEAMVDEMGFIVPFQGGKVPKETCGDTASSAVHRYLGLAEMVHSVPQKLQLSHPTEISSIAAQVRRPATGMRLNPSLLSEEDRSRGRAAIIPGMSGKMPSASKDRLEVEDSWASLKCRVQAIGNALDEEAEAQQFNAKCCWICENWCEYRLMFSKKGGKVEANFVYALTSLDGFTRPIQLKKLGNHWAASKMLPPSLAAVEVIFIVDGQAMLSDSHSVRHIVPKSVVLDPEIFGLREAQPDEARHSGQLPSWWKSAL